LAAAGHSNGGTKSLFSAALSVAAAEAGGGIGVTGTDADCMCIIGTDEDDDAALRKSGSQSPVIYYVDKVRVSVASPGGDSGKKDT